jgi:hypothetical protein
MPTFTNSTEPAARTRCRGDPRGADGSPPSLRSDETSWHRPASIGRANRWARAGIDMLLSTDAQIRQLSTNEILTLDQSRLTVRSRDLIPSVRTLLGDNWRTANDSSKRQRLRDRLGRVDWRLEGPASERTTVSTRFREELWDPEGNDPVWEVRVDSREPLASGPPPEPSPRHIANRLHNPNELQWIIRTRAVLSAYGHDLRLSELT